MPQRRNLDVQFASLPFTLLLLLTQAVADLPYNPTRIINTQDTVYILDPASLTLPHGQLRSFKTNTNLDAGSLSAKTVGYLPWYNATQSNTNSALAYTPILNTDGSIAVLAGNCSAGVAGSALYKFTPATSQWAKQTLGDDTGVAVSNTLTGASYLGAGVSFSPNMTGQEMDVFVFGGMCPFANTTADTWMTSAKYSNSLLKIQEKTSGDRLSVISQTSQLPVAEAGFTFTPLQATYSNTSSGSNVVQQDFLLLGGHTNGGFMNMSLIALLSLPQASWTFVSVTTPSDKTELLKRDANDITPRSGHTAVLSTDGTKIVVIGGWVGDISTPADPQIAVLDVGVGYGGAGDWTWTTPSATNSPFTSGSGIYGHGAAMLPGNILLVTGGYNIAGSSTSKFRRQTTSSASSNVHNYFYNITSSSWITSYDAEAAAASVSGATTTAPASSRNVGVGMGVAFGLAGLMLLVWLSWWYWRRYKRLHEEDQAPQMSERHESDYSGVLTGPYGGSEYPSSSHAGRPRTASTVDYHSSTDDLQPSASVWGRPRSREGWPWMPGDPEGLNAVGTEAREAERTGLDVDFPSPQRGLRQSFKAARGGYHSAPRFDYEDSRPSRAYGDMYAIEELSEHENSAPSSRVASHQHAGSPLINNQTTLDPFRDPDGVDGHHPPAPLPQSHQRPLRHMNSNLDLSVTTDSSQSRNGTITSATQRRLEMVQWVQDWEAAGNSPTRSSRSASPEKSDRTMSNLSDQSLLSAGSLQRQQSTRSVVRQYFPGLLSKSNSTASNSNHSHSTKGEPSGLNIPRSRPTAQHRRIPSNGEPSTGFSHLQSESQNLLGHNSNVVSPPPTTARRHRPSIEPDTMPTFSRALSTTSTKTTQTTTTLGSRIGGFVGSVRRAYLPRALSFGSLAGNRSSSMTRAGGRPLAGVINGDGYYEYRDDVGGDAERRRAAGPGVRSTASSPIKHTEGFDDEEEAEETDVAKQDASEWGESTRKAIVRRSVSDSGPAYWAVKRGKSDWERDRAGRASMVEQDPITRPSARGMFTGRTSLAAPTSNALRTSVSTTGATRGTSDHSRSRSRSRIGNRVIRETTSHGSNVGASRPETGSTGRNGRSGGEEEWDVEAAVEERVVQVMFTVPRARLRVVNADVDSERDGLAETVAGVGDVGDARGSDATRRDKGKGGAVDVVDNRYDGSGWS